MKQFKPNDKVKLVKKCEPKCSDCKLIQKQELKVTKILKDGKYIECVGTDKDVNIFYPSQLQLINPKVKKTKTVTQKVWSELNQENKKLKAEIKDLNDIYLETMEEVSECNGIDDRHHCTCVPFLRRGIKELQAELKELKEKWSITK